MTTIGQWKKDAITRLTEAGCPDAAIDASWMLEDCLHLTRAELRFEQNEAIATEKLEDLNTMLAQRADGEPVQYILHSADFMGLKFYVDERVLIPRQDTETLVEAAVGRLLDMKKPSVLDLCAGSGAIGLSVKTLVPGAEVTLSDISEGAVEIIHRNAKSLETEVEILQGSLFDTVRGRTFDLIASNPPYIPAADIPVLQREVRREPSLALDGGEDGLDFYRSIAMDAGAHLNKGGWLYFEVGIGQAADVLKIIKENINTSECGCIKDLCGVDRVVWARSA